MIRYCLIATLAILIMAFMMATFAEKSSETPADSGVISFSGEIVERTCLVNGHPVGSDFVVQLPQVKSSHLKQSGQRDGDTEFHIHLSGCSQAVHGVRARFDMTAPQPSHVKRFALSHDALHPDMAKNVMVEVDDKTPNATTDEMVFHPIDEQGNADIPYVARYYATSPVTAGKVHSRVTYVLEYQ